MKKILLMLVGCLLMAGGSAKAATTETATSVKFVKVNSIDELNDTDTFVIWSAKESGSQYQYPSYMGRTLLSGRFKGVYDSYTSTIDAIYEELDIEPDEAQYINFEKTSDGKYLIKFLNGDNAGKYLKATSNTSKLSIVDKADATATTITFDSSNRPEINFGSNYLRYNAASSYQYFSNYSKTLGGAPYIYKMREAGLPEADVQIENVICKVNDMQELTFTKRPTDIGTLTYTSSNENVAMVEDDTVYAFAEGEATITVSWAEGVYQAGSTTFTVTVLAEDAVAAPEITPNGGGISVLDKIAINSIDENAELSYTATKAGETAGEFIPYAEPFTLAEGEWTVVAKSTVGEKSNESTATFTVSKLEAEGLKYAEHNFTAYIKEQPFTAPVLENPNNLPIKYTSSKNDVATVDEAGNVTLFSEGETRITATFEGNEIYKASESSYTLTVEETRPLNATFNFTTGSTTPGEKGAYGMTVKNANSTPMYEQDITSINEGIANVSFTGNYRIFTNADGNHLRVHKNSTMTISLADADYMISKIKFDTEISHISATPGTYSTDTWTPAEGVETSEVKFSNSDTNKINTITVEWALKPVKAPAIKVNDVDCTSDAITLDETTKEAKIDLGTVSDKYTLWYMWTPANGKRLASAAEEGYTEYTEPITVTENGTLTYFAEHKATGTRSEVKTLTISIPTGVAAIEAENGQAEYFDLQGRRVNADELVEGIYIRRANGNTEKVVVK